MLSGRVNYRGTPAKKRGAHRRTSQNKIWGDNEALPKFCDKCSNHDFLVLYGEDEDQISF